MAKKKSRKPNHHARTKHENGFIFEILEQFEDGATSEEIAPLFEKATRYPMTPKTIAKRLNMLVAEGMAHKINRTHWKFGPEPTPEPEQPELPIQKERRPRVATHPDVKELIDKTTRLMGAHSQRMDELDKKMRARLDKFDNELSMLGHSFSDIMRELHAIKNHFNM